MTRLFLDIDGVLADFTTGVHRKLGIDYDPKRWPYKVGPEGWDFHNEIGMSFAELSALCDFEFWESLPWHYDGRDILGVLLRYCTIDEITLLTTPMPHYMSASGKMAWLEKNLPAYKWRTLICSAKKEILAPLPGSILIDDCQRNVDAWEKAGGTAILVPRPWNRQWYEANNAPNIVNAHLSCMEIVS